MKCINTEESRTFSAKLNWVVHKKENYLRKEKMVVVVVVALSYATEKRKQAMRKEHTGTEEDREKDREDEVSVHGTCSFCCLAFCFGLKSLGLGFPVCVLEYNPLVLACLMNKINFRLNFFQIFLFFLS